MNLYPTPDDLDQWIASAHKGDRFVYHLGNLMHDKAFRVTMAATGSYQTIRNVPLGLISEAALEAYRAGYVILVQQKMAEDIFRYLAVRTKKYKKPPMAIKKELVRA